MAQAQPLKSIDTHPLSGFNKWLAVKLTNSVGTMWVAYVFAGLALISFPAAILSGSPIIIVAWIAQTFLQLVLLPVIIVGQNVQSAHSDARAEEDFAVNQKVGTEVEEILLSLAALDEKINTLMEKK